VDNCKKMFVLQFFLYYNAVIVTGRGAVWLARLTGGQEVAGSSPVAPIQSFMMYGLESTLNGPSSSIVAVNGPVISWGSRHESEQVPPHPYSKLKVRSYVPSLFLILSFGARGLAPLRVSSIYSSRRPLII
jgi:hypothetical protein